MLGPKLTDPLVTAMKSAIAVAPKSGFVGNVKNHHLYPVMTLPFASLPFGVVLLM